MKRKKAKVIMLPTDKADGTLWKTTSGQLIHTHVSGKYKKEYQPFNLYFVTDDEIKEGDWCYYKNRLGGGNFICQAYKHKDDFRMLYDDGSHNRSIGEGITPLEGECKKIIATTDPELYYTQQNGHLGQAIIQVPQPSTAFIEKYCKVGGIDEVEVEYECHMIDTWLPKVNSHNEVTIHPIKDSWSREEVVDLFRKYQHAKANQLINLEDSLVPLEWIKENL